MIDPADFPRIPRPMWVALHSRHGHHPAALSGALHVEEITRRILEDGYKCHITHIRRTVQQVIYYTNESDWLAVEAEARHVLYHEGGV